MAERRLVVLLVVTAFASGALPISFTLSVGFLVGAIPEVVRQGFDSGAGTRLVWLLAATAAVFVARQVLAPLQEALEIIIRRQIDETLRAKTLADLMRPDRIAHLEDPKLRDHLSLIREGSFNLGASPGGAAVMTVRLLGVSLQALGGAILVGVAFSWWAAAGLLAACLVSRRVVRRAFLAFLTAWVDPEQMRIHRRYEYDLRLGIGPMIAKESRIFGLTDWLVDRFQHDWRGAMRETEVTRNRLFGSFGLAYGLLLVAYALVFLFVAAATSRGSLELSALAISVQASFDLARLSRGGPWDWELEFGTVVLPKVRELEAQAVRATLSVEGMRPIDRRPAEGIRFEGVGFRYPGVDRD